MRDVAAQCCCMLATDDDGRQIVDYLGDGVRKLLANDTHTCQAVRSAHNFACAEAERFRQKGDTELAKRYDKLRRYIEPRLQFWQDPGKE